MKKIVLLFAFSCLLSSLQAKSLFEKFNVIKQPSIAVKLHKAPIVYHKNYNISFGLLDKLHPFDGKKYGRVAEYLCMQGHIRFYQPEAITDADLLLVHTPEYLASLKNSATIAKIVEISPLCYVPNFLLQRYMLDSMRYATAGTIKAVDLALQWGWAVNLGGGYHHAKANKGEGFCVFADIPLAIKKAREQRPDLKVLIVDLDAHQGNGFETILRDDTLTKIFDVYGYPNYPMDRKAQGAITYNYPVKLGISTKEYTQLLTIELPRAIQETKPDLIIYNAGTDIFEKDRLGRMSVSEEGIIKRDAFVFEQAFAHKTPIAMVLSGGYTSDSARIISKSLENIIKTIVAKE